MYRIKIERRAVKEIKKIIDRKAQSNILDSIEKLKENPRPRNCKKLKGRDGLRIRVGNYRVIYSVKDNELLVLVVKVGHRKKVYE